jgi:hypothetical protein
MRTVLKLRAGYTGATSDQIAAPDKYLDESYYRAALAMLG